ncbi:MAG: class I SAM-dependent methyltransferase [Pyrinomonadaceae bacterium]
MSEQTKSASHWYDDGAGFFGKKYMEGDDSFEGFLMSPQTLAVRTGHEVEGIERLLGLRPGDAVLDCPCGYGRHSIALAQRGYKVLGSDINQEMLNAAYRNVNGTGNIQFARENMLHLDYRDRFDAVINMFLAFGFFDTDEENERVLSNFHRALKPGGRFLLHTDVNVGRITCGQYKFHENRHLRSGRTLEIVESYDPERKRLNGQWILIDSAGAREELPPYSCRIYTAKEITEICRSVGFASVCLYGGWGGEDLEDESEEMIVVATKGE